MELTKYESLKSAAESIGVSIHTLMYADKKQKSFITKRKGEAKVFYIEWLD